MRRRTAAGARVPAIEVGGTHVAAGLVDATTMRVLPGTAVRRSLDAAGTAAEILATIAGAASSVAQQASPASTWGVAIPGPFDYERGIGRFEGVAKLDALHGVDVRGALIERIGPSAGRMVFLNDADAFALGEWAAGGGAGHRRVVGVTLGTGVGSAFLADGAIVDDGPSVPPEGRVDLLRIGDRPLEDTVSRRAIVGRFAALSGSRPDHDVHDIAERARLGDAVAQHVLDEAFRALAATLAPWLVRFEATCLVVGGAMSGSWDLVAPALRTELGTTGVVLVPAALPEEAVLIGTAMRVIGPDASPDHLRSVR
jgi:glucokinase